MRKQFLILFTTLLAMVSMSVSALTYTVYMTSYGEDKLTVIKAVKEITGLGLGDAKTLVESVPCEVITGQTYANAETYAAQLTEAGATVQIYEDGGTPDTGEGNITGTTGFSIYLESSGSSSISVLKVVKKITGLDLKNAKTLLDSAPFSFYGYKTYNSYNAATAWCDSLIAAGATVSPTYGDIIIVDNTYKSCGDDADWFLTEDGTVHVLGSGAMTDFSARESQFYIRGQESATSLVVEEGITHIGSYSFTYSALQNITLPSTLTSIGNDAFSSCSSLTTVTVNSQITMSSPAAVFGNNWQNITILVEDATTGRYYKQLGFNVSPDPDYCYYYVNITADGEPLLASNPWSPEVKYITVTPYINGTAICDPVEYSALDKIQDGNNQVFYFYSIPISNNYAGKTVDFHITTAYDPEYIAPNEVESNSLPMSGEFIIRDVSWTDLSASGTTGQTYSGSNMKVLEGGNWGSPYNPVLLNYVAPTGVTTTPSSLAMAPGDTFDLSTVAFNFQPATSSIPADFEPSWSVGNYTQNLSLDRDVTGAPGHILTALTASEYPMEVYFYAETFSGNIPVTVIESIIPVTGITVADKDKNQVVWVGEEFNSDLFDWRECYLPLDNLFTILPADATNQDVTWTSADASIFTIEGESNEFGGQYGQGHKVGTTTLTVTTDDGGFKGTVKVEVRSHVTNIDLSTVDITMQRGVPFDMTPYVTVQPTNAYDKSIIWSCSNESAFTINGNMITANTLGQYVLDVKSADNPNVGNELTVRVEAAAAGVYASEPIQTKWVGESVNLGIYFEPADATSTITSWTSSNSSVVAISGRTAKDFTATAVKAGTATLTVTTDNGQTATIQVTVKAHVESIQLSERAITVDKGSKTALDNYVTVLPADAFDKSVTWAVSDTATVVTVSKDNDGKWQMKANRSGSTNLVVTSVDNPQVQGFLAVQVESRVSGITTTSETQVVWINGEDWRDAILPLNDLYTIRPKDASNQDVTWTSADASIFSIEGESNEFGGKYGQGQKAGTTTLTVTTAEGGYKGTVDVEVRSHVTSLTLSEKSLTVSKGSTTALDGYVTVLPADAYDKSVTWAVSDTATVVAVSKDASGKWQMKANRSGSTTLIVKSNDNEQAYSTLRVTVEANVTGIKATEEKQVLWLYGTDEERTLSLDDLYTVIPADAKDKSVTIKSSDEEVVSISKTSTHAGYIATALKTGTATLTVTTVVGRYKAYIQVEVRAHVQSISVSEQAITLQRGSTDDLSKYLTVLPENAFDKTVTWKSADESIVSTTGNTAIANALGTTTLTVTSSENPQITATLTVTVEAAAAGIYAVNPVQEVWVGENVNLDIYFEPKDATSAITNWTSSDASVVTISGGTTTAFSATAKKAGKATLTVTTDNGQTTTIQVTVKAHVESLQLSEKSITVDKGSTTGLDQYLTVVPADAYDKSVTWAVTDTATVVTVSKDKSGKWQMKANRSGSTTLIVKSTDNPQAYAFLSVEVETHVTGVKTTSDTQVLWVGDILELGDLYTIIPADAANQNVSWKSSNPAVIDYEGNSNEYGGDYAIAKKAGTATLTVTTEEGGYKGTINIEVRAHVTSITLREQAITLQRSSTVDLMQYVSVLPENAFDKAVTWKSADASIVTVNGNTAIANTLGTTTLTATSNDNPQATATLSVTVVAAAAGVYAVNPVQTIAVGDNADLSIYFEPEDATSAITGWTSSDASVVAISGGTTTAFSATAKKTGKATLTVTTDNGQKATIEVTVCNALEEISLTVDEATLEKGATLDLSNIITTTPADALYDLTVEYIPADGSDYHFTVDENGKVTALESTQGDSYEVEIRVTDGFGNCATASVYITVTVSVTSIHLEASEQSIRLDEEVNLGYTVTPGDADLPEEEWSSSNEEVVHVALTDEGWKAYGVGVGTAMVTLTLGDLTSTIDVEVYAVLERIQLNTQGEQIKQGETICLDDFIAGFYPENAADKRVIWKADDDKVVSITQKGGKYYATGLAEGNTSLMVQSVANPEVASYMSLFVRTGITSITAVHPEQYVYTDTYVDLSVEILPAEAADRYVNWTCNDPDAVIFYVDPNTGEYMPQFSKYGDFTLTATPDDGEHTCTISVHVVKHVESITLNEEGPISVDAGTSQSLDKLVVFTPEDAYNKEVVWTSNDENVATVTCTDGKWSVNGITGGRAVLTVTSADNAEATTSIEVLVIQRVTGITAEYPEQTILVGEMAYIACDITPSDAYDTSVTITISDETILGYVENELEYYAEGLKPGKATVTITTNDGGYTATIEVTVLQGANEIQLSTDHIGMDVGETVDFNKYITAILPEDASDKSVVWELAREENSEYLTISEDGHTATALKETNGQIEVYVRALWGSGLQNVWVDIYKRPHKIIVDKPDQNVMSNTIIDMGYKVLPEGARYSKDDIVWTTTDAKVVYVGHDVYATHYTEEPVAISRKPGKALLIVSLPDEDLADTITVTVSAPELEWISANNITTMKGETATTVIEAYPEYAYVDPDKLTVSTTEDYGSWEPFHYVVDTNEEGQTIIEVESYTWGDYPLQLDYPETRGAGISLYIGQPIDLAKGWNWVSMASSPWPVEGLARIIDAFDDKLNDARTTSDLLYLDPSVGLFGTLDKFDGGCYKIEVNDDVRFENPYPTYPLNRGIETTLKKGWNWLCYPYDQSGMLDYLNSRNVFASAAKGDRIVSKDDGFAEYDGSKWTGTLTTLEENAGYMFLSANDIQLQWPAPGTFLQQKPEVSKATGRRTLVGSDDTWQYDHRRFADNMTVIATVSGLDFPDDCTIGAFVDGECRGKGTYVDGRFFITIHGKAGETVQFVVRDEATDSWYNVPGALAFDIMAGTFDHPVPLKAGEKTTAIVLPGSDVNAADNAVYDLSGRRLVNPTPGVHIMNGKLTIIK